jgi:4'-phosphopantetheinyl transferase
VNIVVREWRHPAGQAVGALSAHDVHVWHWRHEAAFAHDADPYRPLSADERARAARFLVEKPRTEFVATRSTLRQILGAYLGAQAESLSFRYSDRGKPSLDRHPEICFNVSHSEGLSVLAVARGHDVGVDVEWIRSDVEAAALAERFFSPAERETLLKLSGEVIQQAFFRCWTRKEAYIKARGDGLSLALDSFDVSLEPEATSALLRTRPDSTQARLWVVSNLALARGYAGALALAASPNL